MKKRLLFLLMMIAVIGGSAITVMAAGEESPCYVQSGAIYYEASDDFGSGRYGVVKYNNPYTEIPCEAHIDGYSYLNKYGEIIISDYQKGESNIVIPEEPQDSTKLLVHFWNQACDRNGWVDYNYISSTYLEEKTPEQIVEQIDVDIKKGMKTTLIIDVSGSMSNDQSEVVKLLSTLDFDEETKILAFNDFSYYLNDDDLKSQNYETGGGTDMFQAINKAVEISSEQLIIISDLETIGGNLIASDEIKDITIYDPDYSQTDEWVVEQLTGAYPNAQIQSIKIY